MTVKNKEGVKTREALVKENKDYTFFSWCPQNGVNPIAVDRVDGIYIYDKNGKEYIDFSSQLMNVNIGHNHPKVKDAIIKQLDSVAYVFPGMATESRGALGKNSRDYTRRA